MGTGLDAGGREHAAEAVSGDDLTGHDARQAQLLYRAALDTAARDAAGIEPAKATISDIRALSTRQHASPVGSVDGRGVLCDLCTVAR